MSDDWPGLTWREVDPKRVELDRGRVEHAVTQILASHPMRHDEQRLHQEIADALSSIAPWLSAYAWSGSNPPPIQIERPWLALEPAAEAARIAAGTASVVAAIVELRDWLDELERAFAAVPPPQLDSAEAIAAATHLLIAQLDGVVDGYILHVAIAWYLERAGVPAHYALDASCNAFLDDHGYAQWPPPRGVDEAVLALASSLIEAQTEQPG
ncbi:MAG: hypothetical protein H0V17_25515 [Deltaproteobacteria bacterium]|nr:hypothetical protein [Deltaproteobacteria bacterium]